jgi:hypothetical protein
MSDDTEIFRHVLQKRIDNAEYWREIVILEDSTGTLKAIRPGIPNRFEWICSSKEAATEQALKCLQQSKNDNWLLSPSASSAA